MDGAGVDRKALEALFGWYEAIGVDAVVLDAPVDRFRAPSPAAPSIDRRSPTRLPAGEAPPAAPLAAPSVSGERSRGSEVDEVMQARAEAARAATLEDLHRILDQFEGCALRQTARQLVFSDGNPAGRLMLIGEAPGREEDAQGKPFVGRSGQLLDRMLAAIGLDRSTAYIANVVPWRPPGNRTPSPLETEICKPFIARQIELAEPDVLVFLGGAAAKAITGSTEGILRARGKWSTYRAGGREIACMATLHPAYLLRQPAQKRLAWRDFLAIRNRLEGAE
ncbi:uracil-DNA glycosylase [Amorphus orientalis]|uniref:uracil-DNA glycosylase n=1 Tax=Amorphus orientalis TaxID=649198 RepID=UPI0027D863A8|nr:uracil-DNA glycosylase [Amorphus orientalis]